MTRRFSSSPWLPTSLECIRRRCGPTTGWAWSRRGVRPIQRLSQDEGINLEGIRRILHMQDEIDDLRVRMQELSQLLTAMRAAPPASRLFTADPLGGVHLGGARVRPTPRALPGPRN